MAKFNKHFYLSPDAPLLYEDHGRPVTRRQFIRQSMIGGSASLLTGGVFSLFANPNLAHAQVAPDLNVLATDIGCVLAGLGAGQSVPFICFDLAGGANLAGSNVLVGQGDGQMDLLSTAGYRKLGLPGDMLPGQDSSGTTLLNSSATNDFTNNDLNLIFHADSAMLRGILDKAAGTVGNVDGCVIPARSDNDTGNNPHNPLYALAKTGARGTVVDLIGSRNSVSGGNSMAPAQTIDAEFRPTKIDRMRDVLGLVDVGDLGGILEPSDVTAVMESIARITHKKLRMGTVDTGLSNDEVVKDLVQCGYLKSADIASRAGVNPIDPNLPDIIGPIFSQTEYDNDREFRKTAAVMKMVVSGRAAGGCITMGGYDYHTGNRRTGENRDLRAGRCIGACLEYARLQGKPLMIYVFSDGSVFSNGNSDDTANSGAGANLVLGGRGKGQWTGDNSSTACSFFLAFRPAVAPNLSANGLAPALHRQIGRMNSGASVVTSATPAANNVNLLVNMVMLNYMALNGQISPGNTTAFTTAFANHGLGNDNNLNNFIAFDAL